MLKITGSDYIYFVSFSLKSITYPTPTYDKYTDNREILFDSLNWLPSNINIDVNLLTKGSDFLTYQENTTIFKHAFKYIKDSKRFTIV